jgi:drug/metabolite transporter (DMT)-like permease
MALAFWRWVLVAVLVTPFALRPTLREWTVIRRHPVRLAALGITGTSMFSILGYWGVQYTTGTSAVLLNATTPVFTVLLGTLVLGERISMRLIIAVLCGVLGLALIASQGDLARLLAADVNRGDLIILVAIFLWALYTVGLRWRPAGLSGLPFFYISAVFGLAACVPFWLVEYLHGARPVVEWRSGLAVLYLALFPSITAYLCYAWAVARVGHTVGAMFSNVTAVLGALGAMVFLGESAHAYHAIALALVTLGVYLVSVGRKPG